MQFIARQLHAHRFYCTVKKEGKNDEEVSVSICSHLELVSFILEKSSANDQFYIQFNKDCQHKVGS